MKTDILTLLRKHQPHSKLLERAADEIERLRAELQSYYDEDEEIRRGRSGE